MGEERYLKGNRYKVAIILFLLVAIPVNGLIWFFAYHEFATEKAFISYEASGNVDKLRIRIGANFKLIA